MALIGGVIQSPISDRWGRKRATAVAATLLVVGNALQAGAVHIVMFLVGRYITGLGAGMIISNTPVYLSEISPAHSRGLLVGLQGNFIVGGYIVSSSAALGFHFVEASYQWRLNFIIATTCGLALLASLISLPESPRWLAEKGRAADAGKVLDSIHKTPDDPDGRIAHAELAQIVAQIELDRTLPSGWLYILRTKPMRKRLVCTLLVWSMAQSTGITVLANLTPRLFGALGYNTVLQLALSLVWTVCLFIGCFFNIFLIDRIGRVKLIGKSVTRQLRVSGVLTNVCSRRGMGHGYPTRYRGCTSSELLERLQPRWYKGCRCHIFSYGLVVHMYLRMHRLRVWL